MRLARDAVRRAVGALPLLSCLVACAPGRSVRPAALEARPDEAAAESQDDGRCDYRVTSTSSPPFRLSVSARCHGTATGFELSEPELSAFVATSERTARGGVTELDYRVDLERMADHFARFNVAARFGKSLLVPASSFLMVPVPRRAGVPVSVAVDEPPGFATGLRRQGDRYLLESHEIRVATYTAFGARSVHELGVPGMRARVALLDGPLSLDADSVVGWVEQGLADVVEFYAQPPDDELLVVVAPVSERRGVLFGYLLPESAPGIVLLVGEHSSEADLNRDWVLLHELIHVGSPSFRDEAAWFDEGLATYFEPIVRARGGRSNEHALWKDLLRELPRGLDALTRVGLEKGSGRDEIYWGGALFCLLADVEARRSSGGERGLEHGLRAVLKAGGRSSEVWSFSDAIEVIDQALGGPVLATLVERYGTRPSALDLDALFRELGVVRTNDGVHFDDSAPLAGVRRAILSG